MENNRNFFITIALSILILTAWQVLYMNPRIEAQREQARIEAARMQQQAGGTGEAVDTTTNPALPTPGLAPGQTADATLPGQTPVEVPGQKLEAALAADKRVLIDTPSLSGSINLTGGRIDDLLLKDYRVTVSKTSDNIRLLNPASLANGYFAEQGYIAGANAGTAPGPQTIWSLEGNGTLTPATPIVLTHTNDAGLTFRREISVDDKYMFTVKDTISNGSAVDATLSPYGRVTRFDKPTTPSIWVLHEGPLGVAGEKGLMEYSYSSMEKEKEVKPGPVSDGWLGITDKYWATAVVPSSASPFTPRFSYFADGRPRYQVDYLSNPLVLKAGSDATVTSLVFAGAKEVDVVDSYETKHEIKQFDLLIDWGWFYFFTKPLFWIMDHLFKLIGNFGVAILVTTVLVKAVFYPLANKSYASMAKMKVVQPKMLEIREKYADDKMKQQQAMMELYKKEKINPVAGCWPVLLQIPVFFALYKVIYVTIEMRHAPFFGWIQDLSAPDPTSLFNLFGLLPYDVPHFLLIGVWPLIMGVTMFLQMQMNPTPPDPTQAMIFKWMPIMFTFMLATFPAGLVIYWAWNNFLSIIQQGIIMRRNGARIELWDNLKGLFGGGKAETPK